MNKILTTIICALLFLSCHKATIHLDGFDSSALVGKWELTNMTLERITNNPAITDEELLEGEAEPGSARFEFFEDGRVILSFLYYDEDDVLQSLDYEAKYTLSADNKTLTVEDEEGDTLWEILSLTSTTFVYREKGSVDLLGEEEEFWLTSYYKKVN